MILAPIVLFVYNRLWHTQQTIEALKRNILADQSELYIYADGVKNEQDRLSVEAVREYIKTVSGFKSVKIFESKVNKGLAKSIITGVTEILEIHGKIIVLEDDMVTSKYFLKYLNQGLEIYEFEDEVISIHAYSYPIKYKPTNPYFLVGADCWGWATWKRGWEIFEHDAEVLYNKILKANRGNAFDFNNSFPYLQMLKNQADGKIDSWAIRWYASAFLANKLTMYPNESMVDNIGIDGSGTHCTPDSKYEIGKLNEKEVTIKRTAIKPSKLMYFLFSDFFKPKSRVSHLYHHLLYS